jgi:hypothetical protein
MGSDVAGETSKYTAGVYVRAVDSAVCTKLNEEKTLLGAILLNPHVIDEDLEMPFGMTVLEQSNWENI